MTKSKRTKFFFPKMASDDPPTPIEVRIHRACTANDMRQLVKGTLIEEFGEDLVKKGWDDINMLGTFESAPLLKLTFESVPLPKLTFESVPLPKLTLQSVPLPKLTFESVPFPKLTFQSVPFPKLTFESVALPKLTFRVGG